MWLVLILSMSLSLALRGQAPQAPTEDDSKPGSVKGVVLNSVTGEPLAVQIRSLALIPHEIAAGLLTPEIFPIVATP